MPWQSPTGPKLCVDLTRWVAQASVAAELGCSNKAATTRVVQPVEGGTESDRLGCPVLAQASHFPPWKKSGPTDQGSWVKLCE